MTALWVNTILSAKRSGLICKVCGTLLGTKGKGVPRNCDTCLDVAAVEALEAARGAELEKLMAERQCPVCKKVLRSLAGRNQHMRMAHSSGDNERLLA